jgi:hypothetical protein
VAGSMSEAGCSVHAGPDETLYFVCCICSKASVNGHTKLFLKMVAGERLNLLIRKRGIHFIREIATENNIHDAF